MSLLPAIRDTFGARHLVGKSYPGLGHIEQKGLVASGSRRARHRYTPLNQMLVNSDLHCTIPLVRGAADMSVEYGRGSILKWRNAGGTQGTNGSAR
jgi:hypothetical protein